MNYFDYENTFFFSPDEEIGATDNADTDSGQGGTPEKGATQVVKFGNIEVDLSNPESIKKAEDAYRNLQSDYTRKTQELSELRKGQPKKPETAQQEPNKPVSDERVNYLYDRQLNSDLENLVKDSEAKLIEKYGEENYGRAKDEFMSNASKLKSLESSKKANILKTGNLEFLFEKALANSFIRKPNAPQADPKQDVNNYQKQENLPPNPSAPGQPNVPGEIDLNEALKGDDRFRKAAELSKQARSVRGGQGVR